MAGEAETKPRVSLAEIIEETIRRTKLDEIRVGQFATVTKFIPGGSETSYGTLPAMVEVELDVKRVRLGKPDDADEDETVTEIAGELTGEAELSGNYPTFVCPVFYVGPASLWPRGEIEVGEQGLVVWLDREIGRWLVAARSESESTVDPKWSLSHGDNLSSAVFIPGMVNGPNWPGEDIAPEVGAKIGPRDGSSTVTMDAAGILMETAQAIAAAAGTTIDLAADGGDATIDASGVVKLGAAASQALALLPELKAPIATLAGVYAGLPGAVYATDIVAIKAGWAAFASSIAALAGSLKGRG